MFCPLHSIHGKSTVLGTFHFCKKMADLPLSLNIVFKLAKKLETTHMV